MSSHKDGDWVIVDDDGNVGIVRDAVLNARSDYLLYQDRSIRREWDGDGVLRSEMERRPNGLRRVWTLDSEWDPATDSWRGSTRYYWRRLRVPGFVWWRYS